MSTNWNQNIIRKFFAKDSVSVLPNKYRELVRKSFDENRIYYDNADIDVVAFYLYLERNRHGSKKIFNKKYDVKASKMYSYKWSESDISDLRDDWKNVEYSTNVGVIVLYMYFYAMKDSTYEQLLDLCILEATGNKS
jgi:hypothetical protein